MVAPAESRGLCLHAAGQGALGLLPGNSLLRALPGAQPWGPRVTALPGSPRRTPPRLGAAAIGPVPLRGPETHTPEAGAERGEVPSQGDAATGEAAGQATWAWAERKGKPRPRVGRGRGITGGGDGPPPPPAPIEEKVEWEGAAPGSPQGWKRGFHSNAPRTGPDVTVGRAPRPPPSLRKAAQAPPTPGTPHWWPRRSLFRTHQ